MDRLLKEIAKADDKQIHTLLDAVIERFRVLYPQWEIGTVSIKKSNNLEDEINRTIALLESVKRVSAEQGSLKQSIAAAVDSIQLNTQ